MPSWELRRLWGIIGIIQISVEKERSCQGKSEAWLSLVLKEMTSANVSWSLLCARHCAESSNKQNDSNSAHWPQSCTCGIILYKVASQGTHRYPFVEVTHSTSATGLFVTYLLIPSIQFFQSAFLLNRTFLHISGGTDSKESVWNARDPGLIPGLGRSPGEGNAYPLRYSCLDNSMERVTWQGAVHGVTKSQTWLSN